MTQALDDFYEFGRFRLDARRRVLLDEENTVVEITPKALEILCVLVKGAGRVVSKEDIISSVWANSFVEEANLSHHVFKLRKALGESESQKYIETVSKRGYRFVSDVRRPVDPMQMSSPHGVEGLHGATSSPYRTAAIVVIGLAMLAGLAFAISRSYRRAPAAEQTLQSRGPDSRNSMTIARVTSSGKVGASTISPDGKFLAYVQNSYDGEGTIYIRQTETNNEIKLLEPDERTFGVTSFSPDGKYVYYVAFDRQDPVGALYRISILGGVSVRLIQNVPSMFTISPDGTRVCFYRNDEERKAQNLTIANLDGSGEQIILVRPYSEFNFCGSPAWSPDGRRIAYSAYTEAVPNRIYEVKLFAIEIDSGSQRQLTSEVWSEVGKMQWAADGRGILLVGSRPRLGIQVYFVSYPSGELQRITNELNSYGNYGLGITDDGSTLVADVWENSAQLWSINADGETRDAVQLTSGDSDGASGLAGLPDGEIVYSSRTGFDSDLWTLRSRSDKREGKPLTNDEFYEGEVAAAQNGQFIVFVSDRAGNQHLFRSNASGSEIRQLTFGDTIDGRPDITRDGAWIVFGSWQDNRPRIWKIPAEGGVPGQLTDYDSLAPAISPDGKFVSCISPSKSPAQPSRLDVISFETGAIVRSFDVIPYDYDYRPPRWTPNGDAVVYRKVEKNVGNLWKQNVAGGDARAFTNFKSDIVFGYAFASDGKKIIVSRGKRTVNVVTIKNFR